jgi:hypothetical protein
MKKSQRAKIIYLEEQMLLWDKRSLLQFRRQHWGNQPRDGAKSTLVTQRRTPSRAQQSSKLNGMKVMIYALSQI